MQQPTEKLNGIIDQLSDVVNEVATLRDQLHNAYQEMDALRETIRVLRARRASSNPVYLPRASFLADREFRASQFRKYLGLAGVAGVYYNASVGRVVRVPMTNPDGAHRFNYRFKSVPASAGVWQSKTSLADKLEVGPSGTRTASIVERGIDAMIHDGLVEESEDGYVRLIRRA